jgi:polysaccharide pyruvyl transferase WcaK-like protein
MPHAAKRLRHEEPLSDNTDNDLTPNHTIRRIGLISPCLGNLGNAAILSSMVANIRKRIPDAEIIGITLSPEDTRRRHGIDAFPITCASRANYSPSNPNNSEAQHQPTNGLWRIKEGLKRIPFLRYLVRAVRLVCMELAHIVAASRLVRKLDRVIITGGGALDEFWGGPWGHPWTLFKFAVLSRVWRVPFLFVSVGKCSLEHPLSRFFARNALSLAEYRSYRDNDSKIAVQTLLHSSGDPVCPDLAYSYRCPDLPGRRNHILQDERLVVGVSPISYCDPRVWPLKDEQRYARYLHELAEMVKWLIRQRHLVLLFATDSPDVDTICDLQAMISDGSVDARSVQVLPGPPEQTTEGLLRGICQADLVIASRLHGVILSQLIAIPVLGISYDRKVDVHMSDIGQSEHCVNIDHVDASALIERFSVLRDVRERESAHLKRAVQLYREQVDAQYDRLLGPIQSGCGIEENQERMIAPVGS